ncbi:hypothetical protein GGI35DRAFT_336491 [Trichoderma velutinum]
MLTGRDVRILKCILISLCISGVIAVITYATRTAYAEMYGSLIPNNGTFFAISSDDHRQMGFAPTPAVIDVRSLKKRKLSGRKITHIAVAGAIVLSIGCSVVWMAKERILEWIRSRRPPKSPVLINLEDIVNKIRNRSLSRRRRSIYAEGQEPDPCLPDGQQQIGQGSRAIPPAFMIREVKLPTIRPASDSIKSAPAVLPTQDMSSTTANSNSPETPSATAASVPTGLTLELTRNITPPNSEAVSSLTPPNSEAMSSLTQSTSENTDNSA